MLFYTAISVTVLDTQLLMLLFVVDALYIYPVIDVTICSRYPIYLPSY